MSSRKVVAVFGAYFNGNFGDDLMGHLIATNLSEAGYEPLLWRGPDYSIGGKKWKNADHVDDFLKDTRCVVFGGGMVFCNSNFPEYWQDMADVLDVCEKRNIPIVAISVGSDGHFDNLHPISNRLLKSSALVAVSLRLTTDVEPVKSFSQDRCIVQYSDIVLASSILTQRERAVKVLICMAVGRIERFLLGISFLMMRLKGLEVCSISQFVDSRPESNHFIKLNGKNYSNKGVTSVLEAVRNCDVVIGRGLHVGMAALASGSSFVSFRSTGKTVIFMNEIGQGENVITTNARIVKPWLFLKLFKVVGAMKPRIDNSLYTLQQNAGEHYRFMLDQIDRYM